MTGNPMSDADELVTKLAGSTDKLARPLEVGDRLTLIVEATVVGLGLTADRATRVLKIVDVHELDGELGRGLILALRGARRAAEEAAAGRTVLPGLEVTTDVAGIVATATEAAAMRGDPNPEPEPEAEPAGDVAADPWADLAGEPGVLLPDEGPALASAAFPGPVVVLDDFVDTLGRPLAQATATELKVALEAHVRKVGPEAMVAIAAGLGRFEEGRKAPRSRVLNACTAYLSLPTPPPGAQAGDHPADTPPVESDELGDDGELELDADVELAPADAFPDPPDEGDELDAGFGDFDLEDEAP